MSIITLKTTVSSLERSVREQILPYLEDRGAHIITLEGPLGAGKTTLTKALLLAMGVLDVVNSPTFGYVNSYKSATGRQINHFDLYRLKTIEDFYQEALDELLLDQQAYNFIEWPGLIEPLLSEKTVAVRRASLFLSYDADDLESRIVICK